MGWENNKMTKPIGMGDIRKAVNYGSLDLGTLIANGIINKWQKRKPIQANLPALTEQQRTAANNGGNGYAWGMSIPNTFTTKSTFMAGWQSAVWSYLRPRGQNRTPQELSLIHI